MRIKSLLVGMILASVSLCYVPKKSGASLFSVQSAPTLTQNLPSPTVKPGAEKVFSLNRFLEFGGAYGPMFVNYDDGSYGALRLFNIVSHLRIPGLSRLRLDTALGLSQRTLVTGDPKRMTKSSGLAPGGGFGLSYPLNLGKSIAMGPHLGLRFIRNGPASFFQRGPEGTMLEMGGDITIKL